MDKETEAKNGKQAHLAQEASWDLAGPSVKVYQPQTQSPSSAMLWREFQLAQGRLATEEFGIARVQ